ncbi:MAG: hypothetical protein ACE5HX_12485, partial [bacterium]
MLLLLKSTTNLPALNRPTFFVVGLILFCVINKSVLSQEKKYDETISFSDSLSEDNWSDETYYGIEMLRLQRWIRENTQKLSDPVLLKEIVRLKKEAENFAENEDFTMAVFWLETIWDLLQPDEEFISNDGEGELMPDFGNLVNSFSSNKFNWFKELSMGVDIWRQEFQLALIQGDSTFLEGSGNPYTGIRLSFDYTLNYQQSIQGYTFFKYSRDYLSGEAELSFVNPLGNYSLWKLENHFEGNSFYRDDNLKYFQNISSLAFKLREFGPFTLDLEDEFLLRRYDNESNTYPNYFNNSFNGLAKLDLGIGSYIGASYRNVQRIHSNYDVNDYQENRFELSWFQAVSRNMSFSFENELRFRNYTNVPVDTTFQDYWEDYFRGDLRIPFHSFLGTEIQGSITKRDYDFFSVKSLPDYVQWEIEPELYFNLGSDWRISAGFYYSEQIHQKFVNRVPVASVDAAMSIPFEDYFS